MKERDSLSLKKLENCKESKIIFDNGDYFIECNGKLYKIVNDMLAEID
jgi:hypothetical protein